MYEEYYLRRGYFRRSKRGDYIKIDGRYERVHPGEGQYIWVQSKYQKRPTKSHREGK